ncbi:MAG: excinuclease ABC subunit UvrA [Nannocystaceae bacterium]|nr:excinuclease ABC subunit UvrA [bacterium]
MSASKLVVRGARTHNLRDLDLDLPRDALVVITGPSGSGKSSLAFDTIFAEGQRRYVESLSVAARQALSQLPKPDVDLIEGLSPAVAIDQSSRPRNPRSTVGTVTEIDDYLRLLYARVGEVYSHRSGAKMQRHSVQDMVEALLALEPGTRFSILAPVVVGQPGDHADTLDGLRREGFTRVAIDDEVRDLGEPQTLDPSERHTIEVYVDRLKLKDGIRGRLADSLEIAARLADGVVKVLTVEGQTLRFSERFADHDHDIAYPELTPSLLSFNSPAGACPECDGLGTRFSPDLALLVPDPRKSVADGALAVLGGRGGAPLRKRVVALLEEHADTPWRRLDPAVKLLVLEGSGTVSPPGMRKPFEGVFGWMRRKLAEEDASTKEDADAVRAIRGFFSDTVCPACEGARLRLEARMVKVDGHGLHEVSRWPLRRLGAWVRGLELGGAAGDVAAVVLAQVEARLRFLDDLGLGYLTLARRARSLSGGEAQRIRLATQVGAGLVGITYILDEPSIGLHQRDNDRLIAALERLRDLGNTVIVVEHDEDTMRAADWIVDMGPGAGARGGQVVAAGTLQQICDAPESATGRYLAGVDVGPPSSPRRGRTKQLTLEGARGNNLDDVTVSFPVGRLTCVTGVSGSGKSSLVVDTLLPEAARVLNHATRRGLPHDAVRGLGAFDKVVHVDQSPIGRSARSNPATYTGILGDLRAVFAQLPDARLRGYTASRFSFNVKGGRCEACKGEGVRRIAMDFLPDLFTKCDTCRGRRYNPETLAVTLRGKSIADVLAMSVAEAFDFLVAYPSIRAKLEVLRDVGLGYVPLGQSALTLSGGEAQRIKLARDLSRKATGATLYVLDEPTTGLHFADVMLLIGVLSRLVDAGNTVLVIEHNLDVIARADYIVDLGPEGGDDGGSIVATGTPAQVAKNTASHTGRVLGPVLARLKSSRPDPLDP